MDETTTNALPAFDVHDRSGRLLPEVHDLRSAHLEPGDLGIGRLFWTMRDAVVVGDIETGAIVLWNPAAERLFGWSASEAVGAPLEWVIPNRLRSAHHAGMTRYATQGCGALIDRETPTEVPAVRKDGTEITVELSLTPLSHLTSTDVGIPRFVVAFIRDATERTRLAAERTAVLAAAHDYARRLEELATLKSCFTSMVAHELGGPVATIGALANLLERGVNPEEQPSIVQAIRSEIRILHRLVHDIQAASAIERDAFAIRAHLLPVSVLVADAVAFARTLADDHPMGNDVADDVLVMQVKADSDRIGQVLRNLLSNAVKHTPPGTAVELRVFPKNGRVRFQVTDKGPGIPPADLTRVFAKFARGQDAENRMTPGVGLGLYLARQILRAHGSELCVSSTLEKGTTFNFDLESSP